MAFGSSQHRAGGAETCPSRRFAPRSLGQHQPTYLLMARDQGAPATAGFDPRPLTFEMYGGRSPGSSPHVLARSQPLIGAIPALNRVPRTSRRSMQSEFSDRRSAGWRLELTEIADLENGRFCAAACVQLSRVSEFQNGREFGSFLRLAVLRVACGRTAGQL